MVDEPDACRCCSVYLVGCVCHHVDELVVLLLQLAVLSCRLPDDLVFFIHYFKLN